MAKPYISYDGPVVTRSEARAMGVKWFFTGIPCKRGYLSERFTSDGHCRACASEQSAAWFKANSEKAKYRNAAWRKANPEKKKANDAAWRKSNPEKAKATEDAWRAANLDKVNANAAAWRKANPEKRKVIVATWRAANREKRKIAGAAWQKANPEKVLAIKHKRRATERGAGGSWTPADIALLLKQQRGKCAHSWCRKSLMAGFHRDHRTPLALGGTNDWRNIQLLCVQCNRSKAAKHPIDFAQLHGLLL